MKKRLDLRIRADLRDGLDLISQREGILITAIVERYIEQGLSRDNGELVEINSLPGIRQAVSEEFQRCIDRLGQELSTDLQKAAKKSDDRLAALIVKAARGAGIAHRMVYALIAKAFSVDFAMTAYEDSKQKAGRDLTKLD